MAYSVPASPVVFSVSQPDGTKIFLQFQGDEYCHWLETTNGHVVVKNGDCYEYAMISDNQLIPSGIIVSNEGNTSKSDRCNTRSDFLDFFTRKRNEVKSRMNDDIKENYQSDVNEATPILTSVPPNNSLTIGNQKVLCILMEFPDRYFSKSPTDFENMWNQAGYNVAGSQGSINDFYNENSFGQMSVTATIVGPYTAQHNSSYYATGNDISNSNVRKLVSEALNAAKNDIQFKDFDLNGDHYVDAVHVVFAGYASNASAANGLIWPHHWSLQNAVTQGLIYKAKEYFITSELSGGTGTTIAPIGTVCHEYGHQLGAPDYYNDFHTGTWKWDVMGNGSWNNNGRCPAHHNPYTKAYIYNWSTPTIINSSTSNIHYTLNPSFNTANIYRINTTTNGEFFLLENKYAASNTFNSYVPSPGGLNIYHVHSDIENAVASNDVNTTHPQKCYIVCANATSNPNSTPSSYGTLGIECAYPYNNNMFFTESSTPSSTSWAGTATGVNVCYIRRNGNNLHFMVNPIITGPNTLNTMASYYTYVPPTAHIKWTYTFTSNQSLPPNVLIFCKPITFINGDSTATIAIQRGQYPMVHNSSTVWIPYTGTVVLKATITNGTYSHIITKTISLGASSNSLEELDYYNDVDSLWGIEQNETHMDTSDLKQSIDEYRLLCENPIVSSATIQIERFCENGYIPIDRDYTLSIYGDKVGLIQHIKGSQPIIHLGSTNLPNGLYQIVLQVDGKVVTFARVLKY